MSSYTKKQISAARVALCNPYAFMEELESDAEANHPKDLPAANEYITAAPEQLSEGRTLSQNPYSHLNSDGEFDGLALSPAPIQTSSISEASSKDSAEIPRKQTATKEPKKLSDADITKAVKQLHIEIWKQKQNLWRGKPPKNAIELLDPVHGMYLTGFKFERVPGFQSIIKNGESANIAGYLDQDLRQVYISEAFSPETQLFTAAHELGHIFLHKGSLERLHRDRPLDGSKISRDHVERAADKFASIFLMPEKLVKVHFQQRFKSEKLKITEETAFGLGFLNSDKLLKNVKNKRDFSILVAGSKHFHTAHFKSIAAEFRVSVIAMAIRLEELDLVEF